MSRIKWECREGGRQYAGTVNGVRVFTINRTYAHAATPWKLVAKLPLRPPNGADGWSFRHLDEAQGSADQLLDHFMQRIGAVFTDEIPGEA